MIFYKNLSTFSFLYALCFSLAHAATFVITNNCPYTVWAGAVPGGGMRLNPRGGIWNLDVSAGTKGARIWPRTGCSFDEAGRGRCQTGDCDGLLQCQAYGAPPNTLAEYALNQTVRCDNWEKATATRRKLYPAAYSISFESGPPHVGILASTMCNNGGLLRCQAFGAPPNTLAEYAQNQFIYLDFFNISTTRNLAFPQRGYSWGKIHVLWLILFFHKFYPWGSRGVYFAANSCICHDDFNWWGLSLFNHDIFHVKRLYSRAKY